MSVEGTPAMLGHVCGFMALAKQHNPHIEFIHCMIYCQALVVKNLKPEVEAVMNHVIKTVNAVICYELNTWLFCDSCEVTFRWICPE